MSQITKSAFASWNRDWLFSLLLLAATFLAYLPAMHGGFIWDDNFYVTNNLLLSAPDGLKRIWFSQDSPSQYFPLTYTTFRIERTLWGLNPAGYHWVNLLLHAANALLLWRLLKRLSVPGAWLAAAIFALHPVEVESVAWITERKNVLSLFFCLLALLSWVEFIKERPRRYWRFYVMALMFSALALFSKTTACTLPAALLLILWWKENPINWRRLAQVVPFLALGMGMGLLTVWWERYHQGTGEKLFTIGWLERILIASRAVWFYAGKLVWPVNLMFSYPRWTIDPANPLAYGWLAAGAGLGAVIYYARRFLGRGVEVAVLFFVATLSPLLGFIMLFTFRYTFVADHYQYVASIGLIALAAGGLTTAFRFWAKGTPLLKPVVCGGLLMLLGILTWRQCGMYANLETLWRTTIARNPNSFMAYNNLGAILSNKGRADEAIANFKKALAINPNICEIHDDFGKALLRIGRLDEARDQLNQAVMIDPASPYSHCDFGLALLQAGKLDEATVQFRKALECQSVYPEANNNLGNALFQKGQWDEAIAQYRIAIGINPDYAEAHYNLGTVFGLHGQWDEAAEQYRKAIEIKPDYAGAHINLGNVLFQKGQWDEAVEQYRKAIEINPDYAEVHYNLGVALGLEGKLDEVAEQYRQAIKIKPDYADAHGNLAKLLATQGKLDEAINEYQRTLELAPRSDQAHFRYGQALQAQHHFAAAKTEYQKALELDPKHLPAYLSLAWLLATCPEASLRNGGRAVELVEQARSLGGIESPQLLDTLAAAYAEAGHFDQAVETAKRALKLPATQNSQLLDEVIQSRLKLYEANSPFHEKP